MQHSHDANPAGNRLVEDQVVADHKTAKARLDLILRLADGRTFGDQPDGSIKAVEETIGGVDAILGNVEPDIA